MSTRLPIALIGCGGMGHRHLTGLQQLQDAGLSPFDLVAACDPVADNAASLAAEAERLLGRRPETVASTDALAARFPDLVAVDICTSPPHHHPVAADALARGWHAMVEKPMGLTVRACDRMVEAAAAHPDRVLAVAENYRRDPIARLAKAVLDSGALGEPRTLLETHIGGGGRIMITPWRHDKFSSGLLLDVGVHYTDMMEFLLGPVERVYAQTRLREPTRVKGPGGGPSGVYARWPLPDQIDCSAEDVALAVLEFRSGLIGQYTEDHAAHGAGFSKRTVWGSLGAADLPGDRSGKPITVTLDDGRRLNGEEVLELVPNFRLDDVTAALYGGDRMGAYDLPFPVTDAKIMAIEYADFGDAIAGGRPPEVTPAEGRRAVTVAYAMLESQVAGSAVTVEEVLSGAVRAYQAEIDARLGL